MNLGKEPFWVIEPIDSVSESFHFHLLKPSSSLLSGKRSFVTIPYSNPLKHEINPQFYELKSTSLIEIANKEITVKPVFKNVIPKQTYLQHLNLLKEQIQLGTIYEINYCAQFKAHVEELDLMSVFKRLIQLSDVPYNYLIRLNHDYILCCSPETFLKKQNNTLISKPIKGTIRRGQNTTEDKELKEELQNSLKDKTEHVMAVDVARNDLSIIAQKGTVHANNLYNIESFKTVHQMVTEVECTLDNHTSFENIIKATFPMASMTGAPKQSAMNLIDQTEQFKRNYYSGSFGFIETDGNFDLPVVIRSLFYNEISKELSFSVGGAITYLSNPMEELEECLLKAQTMIKAVNAELVWD